MIVWLRWMFGVVGLRLSLVCSWWFLCCVVFNCFLRFFVGSDLVVLCVRKVVFEVGVFIVG